MKNNINLRPQYGQLGVSLLLAMLLIAPQVFGQGIEAMGDLNLDGVIDICDVQNGISTLLTADDISKTGDINGDAAFDIRDVQHIINSALKTASLYKVVTGVIDVSPLDNLEIRAVSDDGLTTSTPVDPTTGAFSISLNVYQGWTMALLNSTTGATLGTFHFLIEDVLSASIPLPTLSEGGEIDLGILYVDSEGVLLSENDIFEDIELADGFPDFEIQSISQPVFERAVKGFMRSYVTELVANMADATGLYNAVSEEELTDLIQMGFTLADEACPENGLPFSDFDEYRTFIENGPLELAQTRIDDIVTEIYDTDLWPFSSRSAFVAENRLSFLLGYSYDDVDQNGNGIRDSHESEGFESIPSTLPIPQQFFLGQKQESLFGLLLREESKRQYCESVSWTLQILEYAYQQGFSWEHPVVDDVNRFQTRNEILQYFSAQLPLLLASTYPNSTEGQRLSVVNTTLEKLEKTLSTLPTMLNNEHFEQYENGGIDRVKGVLSRIQYSWLSNSYNLEIPRPYDIFSFSDCWASSQLTQVSPADTAVFHRCAAFAAMIAFEEFGEKEGIQNLVNQLSQQVANSFLAQYPSFSGRDIIWKDEDNNSIIDFLQPFVDIYLTTAASWAQETGYDTLMVAGQVPLLEAIANNFRSYDSGHDSACGLYSTDRTWYANGQNGIRDCLDPYFIQVGRIHYLDMNHDGYPDWTQDDDNDTVANIYDSHAATDWDTDADDVADVVDYDGDNDGVPTYSDTEPYVPTLWIH